MRNRTLVGFLLLAAFVTIGWVALGRTRSARSQTKPATNPAEKSSDAADWAMDPAAMAPATAPASASAEHTLFDPKVDMPVDEVRPGMTGYGLSVFYGTKIDKFNVKVLSVLKDFNPKFDVILVWCTGANLEHTGGIEGMSGSPIYLKDDKGNYRLAGAFAYGWPFTKDPVGGVQPIQYMLALPDKPVPAVMQAAMAQPRDDGHRVWSLLDLKPFMQVQSQKPGLGIPFGRDVHRAGSYLGDFGAVGNSAAGPFASQSVDDAPRLKPLATPLMTVGIPNSVLDALGPQFEAAGLSPMQAGGVMAGKNDASELAPKMEPGSALVVPLVTGDAEMSAIGTCTDVIDGHVFGFGHSFNNEGPIALPMGTGYINTVIANMNASFKIGALSKITGTLLTDQTVGVAGQQGIKPPMAPMVVRVHYTDGSGDLVYHFQIAKHPKLTPLIAAAAVGAAITGTRNLPQYQTLDYDFQLKFADGQEIHLVNRLVNSGLPQLVQDIGLPMQAATDNPFAQVSIDSIIGTVSVTPEALESEILSVSLPRTKYQPGQTAKLFVSYRPFRGSEAILPIEFPIPRDLQDGTYPLIVSDWQNYIQNEAQTHPFRFDAESIGDVFKVMKDILPLPHNAIYVQLLQQPDGLAIGRTAMSHLPSSRRQILMLAGLSDTTPFYTSTLKIIPTRTVMSGQAAFQIKIERQAKVETAGGAAPSPHAKPAHPAAKPSGAAAPAGAKTEEPKQEPAAP